MCVDLDSEILDELALVFASAAIRDLEKRAAAISVASLRLEGPQHSIEIHSVPKQSGLPRLVRNKCAD